MLFLKLDNAQPQSHVLLLNLSSRDDFSLANCFVPSPLSLSLSLPCLSRVSEKKEIGWDGFIVQFDFLMNLLSHTTSLLGENLSKGLLPSPSRENRALQTSVFPFFLFWMLHEDAICSQPAPSFLPILGLSEDVFSGLHFLSSREATVDLPSPFPINNCSAHSPDFTFQFVFPATPFCIDLLSLLPPSSPFFPPPPLSFTFWAKLAACHPAIELESPRILIPNTYPYIPG